ncbi:MAG: hypothetical protein ACRENP_27875 [Longimicrobiales bacterium]
MTDDAGNFRIAPVRGRVMLRVWKEGYSTYARILTVNADESVEVALTDLEVEFDIVLGRTIRSYVRGNEVRVHSYIEEKVFDLRADLKT